MMSEDDRTLGEDKSSGNDRTMGKERGGGDDGRRVADGELKIRGRVRGGGIRPGKEVMEATEGATDWGQGRRNEATGRGVRGDEERARKRGCNGVGGGGGESDDPFAWLLKPSASTKKLPPGPPGLPIFGSLHLLEELPHRDLHRLAQKYGPIMHLRLGRVNTIVVSSPRAAELFLKAHDLVFASRPLLEAAKYLSYDQKNLSFAPYGSYWRNMRKMCTLELLSNPKINSFRWMRKEELDTLIKSIKKASQCGGMVNLSEKVASLITSMSCRMIFGKKYKDKDIDERVQRFDPRMYAFVGKAKHWELRATDKQA